MNMTLQQKILRIIELGDVIMRAGNPPTFITPRRSDFYVKRAGLRMQKPRRQYYTDDWRWQEGFRQGIWVKCYKNFL